jgi:hypothetical protein
MKTASHHGQTCYFDEKDHKYFVKDQELLSVTKFKGSFFPDFDKEKVARAYAKKHGLDVGGVLADWEAKGEVGRDRGHLLHAYAEEAFTLPFAPNMPENLALLVKAIDIAVTQLSKKYTFLAAEKIVFSTALGLAGQIDLLMQENPCTGKKSDVIILDWKTDKAIEKENVWRRALPPIEHLDDCNFAEYGVQMNIYERIMREEKYFPEGTVYRKGLIHLTEGGPVWYKVPDMQEEVGRMLRWI